MTQQIALIVDDEPDIRELLELTLGRMNLQTQAVADVAQAKSLLAQQRFDLCLTDMRLPDGSGLELVELIQLQYPQTPVAVITAYGSMETAVQALKLGAFDFVSKPVDLSVLRNLVNTALRLNEGPLRDRRSRDQLLGESEVMRLVRSRIAKLSRSQAPVYISGESGTGKELVARMIHEKGPRSEQAFVPVNCGAIPADLMESEFFGHTKGSFTGAVSDKEGLFQAANGGTLFLDEVAELPLHMQVKLLRVIQEKAVRPIGGQKETAIDVRILSATHKDLAQLVQQNKFRQDLFYRINVIELAVPPLRDRSEDIPMLTEHVLNKLAQQWGQNSPIPSDATFAKLQTYPFPGNVRELENILERAVTLCEGQTIEPDDLQLPEHESVQTEAVSLKRANAEESDESDESDTTLGDYLGSMEKDLILKALEKTKYNKTAAAKLLGISFRQLRYRLKKLDIE